MLKHLDIYLTQLGENIVPPITTNPGNCFLGVIHIQVTDFSLVLPHREWQSEVINHLIAQQVKYIPQSNSFWYIMFLAIKITQ